MKRTKSTARATIKTGKMIQNASITKENTHAPKRATRPMIIVNRRMIAPTARIKILITSVEKNFFGSKPFAYLSSSFCHGAKNVLRRIGIEKK
jgi:hypothetical protein